MEISKRLLIPYFEQLKQEFETLEKEISLRGEAANLLPLSVMTRRKIGQIGLLTASLENSGSSEVMSPVSYHDQFRQLKLDLRIARRKWMCLLSNEARVQKMRERRNHVATCAA